MKDAVVVLGQRLQSSSVKATLQLPLTAEERTVLRGRRTTSCGRSVLLQLPREGSLQPGDCLLYTSPSPRDRTRSRMPSSA